MIGQGRDWLGMTPDLAAVTRLYTSLLTKNKVI
jgi:hypothetical protein